MEKYKSIIYILKSKKVFKSLNLLTHSLKTQLKTFKNSKKFLIKEINHSLKQKGGSFLNSILKDSNADFLNCKYAIFLFSDMPQIKAETLKSILKYLDLKKMQGQFLHI